MKYSTFVDNGSTGLNYKRKMNQSFAAATWGGIICTWFVLVRLINIKYYCGDVCLFGLNGSPYSEEGVSWSLKKAKLLSVWMERLDGLGGQLVASWRGCNCIHTIDATSMYHFTFPESMRAEVFVIKACCHGFNFSPYWSWGIQVY